jgi:hypothetical protein
LRHRRVAVEDSGKFADTAADSFGFIADFADDKVVAEPGTPGPNDAKMIRDVPHSFSRSNEGSW